MTRRSKAKLGDLFPKLGLVGDFEAYRSLEVHGIATVEKAQEGDLVFVAQEIFLKHLENCHASAVVVSANLWDRASGIKTAGPKLKSKDAMLAFAHVSSLFSTENTPPPGVHPTAVVHPTARLGTDVIVGPYVVIEEGVEVEENVVLHSHVQLGARSHIGQGSTLFSGVVLYQDTKIGERVRIHSNSVIGADGFGYVQERTPQGVKHVKIHHIGSVRIGNDVEIGASTTIDRGTMGDTIIEDGCIIDNQVQIGHNCHLEKGVIICGCSGLSGSVHVEKYALIAGFVGITNKARIGSGAQIAAYSAIYGSVPPGAKWGGIPARSQREYLRQQVMLGRLPELFESKVSKKHVDGESNRETEK